MSGPKSILKSRTANSAGPSRSSTSSGSQLKLSHAVKIPRSERVDQVVARNEDDENDREGQEDGDGTEDLDADGGSEGDVSTDEEINRAKVGEKRKKPTTKKKPPTSASTFGSTLTSLLTDPSPTSSHPTKKPKPISTTPNQTILSLSNTKLPPSRSEVTLERKAARLLKQQKEEKEDRARIRDVVEGWVGNDGSGSQDFERGLRKVAQRGVIKLFNAILVASKSAEEAKDSLSAKAGLKDEVGSRKEKDNLLGRGGREGKDGLTKEGFLDLVRKG